MLFLYLQNSENLFSIALGLGQPWFVKKVVLKKGANQFTIVLMFCFEILSKTHNKTS